MKELEMKEIRMRRTIEKGRFVEDRAHMNRFVKVICAPIEKKRYGEM
jgi:hypothetical protein